MAPNLNFFWGLFLIQFLMPLAEMNLNELLLHMVDPPELHCRERNRLIGLDKNDIYKFEEAELNSDVELYCHYCHELDDGQPKIWYWQSTNLNSKITEVTLGMSNMPGVDRIYLELDHTLVIKNIKQEDAGIYYCHGPLGEDLEYRYNYLIDVVNRTSPVILESLSDLREKTESQFKRINRKLSDENDYELKTMHDLGYSINVFLESEIWGECNGCFKTRKKFARCRIKPYCIKNKTELNLTYKQNSVFGEEQIGLLNLFKLSCHSLNFAKFFPGISKEIKNIKEYVMIESCYAPCKVLKWLEGKPQYKNTLVIEVGDHITLVCPESTLKTEVYWRRDGLKMINLNKDGNILVDAFSILTIKSATYQDGGNYTCYVDGKCMLEVIIVVLTEGISLKDLLMHIQNLGFIFLFSFIFYAAGLIIAWTRRQNFKQINFETDTQFSTVFVTEEL